MITDAMIRDLGIDIGCMTVMPVTNPQPIQALQALSTAVVLGSHEKESKTKLLTPEQVKEKFRQEGKTFKQFAEQHNFPEVQVYRVMNGTIKATRGRGHQIAVALGLKDA